MRKINMARYRGIIEDASTNENGYSSIKIGGVFYGTFKTPYEHLIGQEVDFDGTEKPGPNGKVYHNANKVVPVNPSAAPAPTPVQPQAAPAPAGVQPAPAPAAAAPVAQPTAPPAAPAAAPRSSGTDARQSSIVLQSSYAKAIDVVELAVGMELLTFKGSKPVKFEQLMDHIDEIARRFYDNCVDTTEFLASNEEPVIDEDEDYNPAEA
jgi:hypothetical protein